MRSPASASGAAPLSTTRCCSDVAEERELDLVSGYGYSLGYLGGGLLFLVNVVMTLKPQLFGLAGCGGRRCAFRS